jgi:hypothetical protein
MLVKELIEELKFLNPPKTIGVIHIRLPVTVTVFKIRCWSQ